jgi:phospho-N-acetylmuramoyl-pentapeptide-transferase
MAIEFLISLIGVFLVTVLLLKWLIPVLISKKVGQRILAIGPRWHQSKEGTPTMGGIGFILPVMLVMAGYFIYTAVVGISPDFIPLALTLAFAICNGAIGFVDDYSKLIKKQNEGLTAWQKLLLQTVIAAAYVTVMAYTGNLVASFALFGRTVSVTPWLFYPMTVIVLMGVTNGGNLTDGIDGLASSVTFVAGGFYAVWAFVAMNVELSLLSAVLLGASLGFLVYNFHPARVFMGDTGSLFFGALVIGTALVMNRPIVGLIVSALFIIEMLSSFLQIFSSFLAWVLFSGISSPSKIAFST